MGEKEKEKSKESDDECAERTESTVSSATTTMSDNHEESGQSEELNEYIEVKQENVIQNATEQKEEINGNEILIRGASSSSTSPSSMPPSTKANDIWLDSLTVLIFFAIVAILFKKFAVAVIGQL